MKMFKNEKIKEISERSKKAQECFAENSLKISTSLLIAFSVTILIVPMSMVIKSIIDPTANQSLFIQQLLSPITIIKIFLFVACEYGVYNVAFSLRKKAFDIYDELYPDDITERNTNE